MSVQLLSTVIGSSVFFALFTLSLGFWGRLILKAFGIQDNNGYGFPLPLVATISCLALILRYVYYLTHDFDLLYSIVFFLGILGYFADFVLTLLQHFKPENNNKAILANYLKFHHSLIVGVVVCVALSIYICLIWPSRTMEPWLSFSMDYYSWMFLADYWRGFADYALGSNDITSYGLDSFGTSILFGFFASSKASMTYMAAPYFIVTIQSWIGICIYHLIRTIFNLPKFLALLLTLGLIFSNFMNYLSFRGHFGHIVGLFGFLACLIMVFLNYNNQNKRQSFFNFLFPILFLFLIYQSVFIVFIAIIILAMILMNTFSDTQTIKNAIIKLPKSIFNSLRKILLPLVVVFILSPPVTYHLFNRSVQASAQQTGIHLGLIEPAFFSGIPIYNDDISFATTNASFLSYTFYIIVILLLVLFVCSKANSTIDDTSKHKIKAITTLLFSCVFVYLCYFLYKGDLYVVWKFSAYSILPLSFVVSSLLFSTLYFLTKANVKIFSAISTIIIVFLLSFPLAAINSNFYGSLGKNTNNKSLLPIVHYISNANRFDKDKSKIFFDFFYPQLNGASLLISVPFKKQVFIMDGMYYFKKVDDYFLNLDDDSVIYTDKIFEGMYSTHFIEPNKFSLERYDMNKLNSQGAVSYIGLRPYSTYADQNEIKIRILIPLHLRNQNLSLKIVLRSNYLTKYQNCKNVVGKYPEGRALDNGRYQNAIFEASIPKEEQDKGFLNFSLFLPGDFPQVDYRLDTETKGGNCGFYFDGITLESVF